MTSARAAYYNEIDPYAAQWLRNLIAAGHIAPGDVDERSITDVWADDVRGYAQCHWFAGIGGWSIALRLAGWDDERPAWTGSCPCQPLSSAGQRKGHVDERHLWPAFHRLIAECRPAVVFGEQVASADGREWLAAVRADLEATGYAVGAANLPACSVGAPHIRQRLWFVADAGRLGARSEGSRSPARAESGLRGEAWQQRLRPDADAGGSAPGLLVDPQGEQVGLPRRAREPRAAAVGGSDTGFWSACHWLPCTDGKARPVEPESFPLAHGVQRRASKLRAYGNAIVPQVAAEFIGACDICNSKVGMR